MRACLLALLMLFCLPPQWAGVATGTPCSHERCTLLHAVLVDAPVQAVADDEMDESHAQHPHCGSCHTGAMVMSVSASFSLNDTTTGLLSGPKLWLEVLLIERPERPKWPTLV
ncbi:MAG: hypothetical protein RL211_257 [Pseudomonadota bacterium]